MTDDTLLAELAEAAKEARSTLKDWIDAAGGCDHSVGICACADYRTLDKIDAAILKYEERQREAIRNGVGL